MPFFGGSIGLYTKKNRALRSHPRREKTKCNEKRLRQIKKVFPQSFLSVSSIRYKSRQERFEIFGRRVSVSAEPMAIRT